jgi:hemerythrin-like domain-containing protein
MRHPSLLPLSHDHHHGLALALRCRKQALGQLKPLGFEGLVERRKECLAFYHDQLIPHFSAEEKVLFPLLRSSAPASSAMIDELLAEHEELRRAMDQLEQGGVAAKLIFDLGDLLERHIRKEERGLFPLFERYVEEGRAQSVGEEMKAVLVQETQAGIRASR